MTLFLLILPMSYRGLRSFLILSPRQNVIKDDGFFILEHPRDLSFAGHRLFFEHRNYGGVNFSFFKP